MARWTPKYRRRRGTGSLFWDREKAAWRAKGVPVDGKRPQKLFRPVKETKVAIGQAEQAGHDWLDALRRGDVTPTSVSTGAHTGDELTVSDWTALWLAQRELEVQAGELARRTLSSYAGDLNRYVVPFIGDVKLSELDGAKLDRWLLDLRRRPSRKGGQLSDSTVQRAYRSLHKLLGDARLDGGNPADQVTRKPRVRDREPAFDRPTFSPGLVKILLDHVETCPKAGGSRLAAAWRLAATTGVRRGELAGLTWSRVKHDRIQVVGTVGVVDHVPFWKGTPKHGQGREVPFLDDDTPAALERWRETQNLERSFAGKAWQATPGFPPNLVFTTETGGVLNPNQLSAWFVDHLDHLRLEGVDVPDGLSLHSLRHAHGSLLIGLGVPLSDVADRLGHSVGVLESTYRHAIQALQVEATRRMRQKYEQAFGSGSG